MINTDDYRAYRKQNENLIKLLKDNQSLLYERISDVLLVLDYVDQLVREHSRIDEELEVIFDAGFSYFHEQWELLQMIYQQYFHHDIISFNIYSPLINYLLYLDDLEETLADKDLLTDERKEEIREMYGIIEEKLINKTSFDISLFDDFDFRLQGIIPDGLMTTMEIFSMIVEELQL